MKATPSHLPALPPVRSKRPAFRLKRPDFSRLTRAPLLEVSWYVVSLLAALIGGLLLFGSAINSDLTATIIQIGLDPLRAQLIVAFILTSGSALLGAALGRHKPGAMIGAGIVFYFRYLQGFIQLQLQPTYDPGGHLEPLNSGALVHTSSIMAALALLCAFIGAAVGVALGAVLLDPPYQLLRALWQRFHASRQQQQGADEAIETTSTATRQRTMRARVASMMSRWLGFALMIVLLVLANGSGDLFLFSPDTGLHTLPTFSKTTAKNTVPAHGTIVQDSVVSEALNGERKQFLVYLPPTYNTPQARMKLYPVLYLLHGSPGGEKDWMTGGKATESADTLIATGKIQELLIVMPDGNGRPNAPSEWGNSFDKKQRIETYVTVDLVRYVDQHYRTVADPIHRGIGGLSMGGFGAMNIASHRPDVFGIVISFGGYYRAEGPIWGKNAAYIQANSPIETFLHNKDDKRLHIYLGAATKDQPYYDDTKKFAQELDKLHIPYTLDLQNGYHEWRIWQIQMYNALQWLHFP